MNHKNKRHFLKSQQYTIIKLVTIDNQMKMKA